ncbi:MAG TPA: SRPBCC family protein [Actinomycetota bacterium]|nr:SRPBCC family protein [Actinomycetota bacterium]
MGRFSESADVPATVEETFAYITDQGRLAEWNDHVQWAEVIDDGRVEVGSKLRQHRKRGRREFDLVFEVTGHDPPRRHVVEGSVFGVDTTMSFTLEPSGPGTRVTMTASVEGRGLRRLLAPVVTSEMRKSTVTALAALPTRLGAP